MFIEILVIHIKIQIGVMLFTRLKFACQNSLDIPMCQKIFLKPFADVHPRVNIN